MKMSTVAKERETNLEESLYHHQLVKIIVMEILKDKKKTWDDFLAENYFAKDEDYDSLESTNENLAGKPRKKS